MQKEWTFRGISGNEYTFTSYPKSCQLPASGGLFILAYVHPRGHLAGYQIHILHLGIAEYFETSISNFHQEQHLKEGCWNTTLTLEHSDTEERERIFHDLKKLEEEYR